MLSAFWLPFWQLCALYNAFHSVCLSVCLSLSHTHTQRRKWWKTVKVVVLKVGLCGRWWETVVTVELKNAKPRHMLTLKWRIKKGIDKGNQAGWVIYSFIDFLLKFWSIFSCEIEPSGTFYYLEKKFPDAVESFRLSYDHHKKYTFCFWFHLNYTQWIQ